MDPEDLKPKKLEADIPNTISQDALQEAYNKACGPIDINGKEPEAVMAEIIRVQLQLLDDYEDDKIVVDKMSALITLDRMLHTSEQILRIEEEDGNDDQADFVYKQVLTLKDIMNRLRGIPVQTNDVCWRPYMSTEELTEKMSADSREIFNHFGPETPSLLNKYSCALEDALIEQVGRINVLVQKIKELQPDASDEEIDVKKMIKDMKKLSNTMKE